MIMKLNTLIFLPVIIFSTIHTAVGEKIRIEIKDKVTIPEKHMVLSDIAYVSCNNPSLLERISNISLGNTPWPGNVRRIERDTVTARLMDEAIDLKDVAYGSATASLVTVESITISGEEIIRKAKEYLLSKLSRPESEIVIESDRPPMDKLLPANGDNIQWEISQIDANKDRSNVQVIVRVSVNEKQYLKVPVFFTIRTYGDIVVANKKMNRHGVLSTDDLVVKRMETTKMTGTTFDNIEDLAGKRTIRQVLPGTPITAEMVDNPPLIKKGDFVKVSVQSGNLNIVTKGVAREDGFAGKGIRIKNIDSSKELYGIVEDSTTVKITF